LDCRLKITLDSAASGGKVGTPKMRTPVVRLEGSACNPSLRTEVGQVVAGKTGQAEVFVWYDTPWAANM